MGDTPLLPLIKILSELFMKHGIAGGMIKNTVAYSNHFLLNNSHSLDGIRRVLGKKITQGLLLVGTIPWNRYGQ